MQPASAYASSPEGVERADCPPDLRSGVILKVLCVASTLAPPHPICQRVGPDLAVLRQELPEALGSLRRLKVLALDQNNIAAVPPAIFLGCDVLQTLSLHENPITIEARGVRCQSPEIERP
jgi:Leucine-rich repeat (LRR) protein